MKQISTKKSFIVFLFSALVASNFAQAQISGTAFRDFNGDGTKQATAAYTEAGIAGLTVKATLANGTVFTTVTAANGTYSFSATEVPLGTDIRIEFIPAVADSLLSASNSGQTYGSMVQFPKGGATNIDAALNSPNSYITDNPATLFIAKQHGTSVPVAGSAHANEPALLLFNESQTGTTSPPTSVATLAQIGNTWGIAYHRQSNTLYSAAFYRKYAGFGPDGQSAIYSTKPGADGVYGTADDVISTFIKLDDYFGANSTGPNPFATIPNGDSSLVAKVSFGDIDISADGKTMYAMNLFDRKIYSIPLNNAGTAPALGTITSSPVVPAISGCTGTTRPFATTVRQDDGKVFIGATCEVNSGLMVVWGFNPTTNTWDAAPSASWDYNAYYPNSGTCCYNDWNNLDYQQGVLAMGLSINPSDNSLVFTYINRDLYAGTTNRNTGNVLKLAWNGTGWDLENNGVVNGNTGTPNNNQGPGGGEFYTDTGVDGPEISTMGATEQLPGRSTVIFTQDDPFGVYTAGIINGNNTTGAQDSKYEISPSSIPYPPPADEFGGKKNPLGDVEYCAKPKPIEIGNRVWIDSDGDGQQDAGEATIPGVIVELVSPGPDGNFGTGDDVVLNTTTTDANGNYYFTGITIPDARKDPNWTAYSSTDILPNLDYQVRIPAAQPNVSTYKLTKTDVSGNGLNTIDNDGVLTTDNLGAAYITANFNSKSDVNHSFDFGFFKPDTIGNYVWNDLNKDGIQDPSEPGVAGVNVTLYNNGADELPGTMDDVIVGSAITDAYGYYQFNNLPDGNYNVGFTLPNNYQFTTTGGTDDANATNSDANTITGRTGTIVLSNGEKELDVDAGIFITPTPIPNSIGDKVWFDTNADGIQDPTEEGVAGVTVTLFDAAGNTIAITTTDAKGNYLFNNLPPNTDYIIGFTPLPGSVLTQNIGGTTPNGNTNSDANVASLKTDVVNTGAPGTAIVGIDAGLIDDVKASLGDRVWIDLNKNGIQDSGEPGVPGVTMILNDAGPDGLANTADDVLVSLTTTDANGYYLFSGLDPAKYFVVAIPPVGYETTTKNTGTNDLKDNDFTAGITSPTDAISDVYDLLAGQKYMGIDMGIFNSTPNLGSLGDKVWLDNNANGVQDANEVGVPGVTVSLLDGAGNPVNNPTTNQPYIVRTDENGNYLFVDLTAGNYKVKFSNIPPNTVFSPNTGTNPATNSDANPNTGITSTVALGAGENKRDVDAGITPYVANGKGSLGNKVWIDANNDGIQDAGEQGVPNVMVTLSKDLNGDGDFTDPGEVAFATTTTNAQGNYMFTNLDGGDYQVTFTNFPVGYSLQAGKNDAGANDAVDSDPNPSTGKTTVITLAQGEENLTIDAGIYNPTATNSIGDKVWLDANADGFQDVAEIGLQGIVVNLLDENGTIIASMVTDKNGNYSFQNLPNGNYKVQVVVPGGFAITGLNAGSNTALDSDIDPATATTRTVSLTGGTNITNLDAGLTTTRAALGNYVWLDNNSDGVQDATEAPVPGVTVSLYFDANANGVIDGTEATNAIATAITNEDGGYFFPNLVPGNYAVGFSNIPAGLAFTQQNAPGDNTNNNNSDANPATGITGIYNLVAGEVDLTADAGLKPYVLGSVGDIVWFDADMNGNRDANEIPVPGVMVTLKNANGDVIGTTLTNGDGSYLFTNVAPGVGYTITFSKLPSFANFTGQTNGNATGSDANPATGVTPSFEIKSGEKTPNIDAGITVYTPLSNAGILKAANKDCKTVLEFTSTNENNWNTINFYNVDNNVKTLVSTKKANNNPSKYVINVFEKQGEHTYVAEVVDNASHITISNRVTVSNNCNQFVTNVYPNPTNNIVNIKLEGVPEGTAFVVTIKDVVGKTVANLESITNVSAQDAKVNLQNMPAGNYFVEIIIDGVQYVSKITKQ